MHNIDLILMLAGGFAAALIFGYITHRLRLSPIVGYLLAGVLIGPQTPGFDADPRLAEQLAEVGVILLMFGVGLHFDLDDLLAVRRIAVPGAAIQCTLATALGALAGHAHGWTWTASLVFGLSLSVASTVVLVRVLSDHNALHTRAGHIAVGWLIVEDILTVFVLVLMPALFGPEGSRGSLAAAIGETALKMTALALILFTVGARAIPWMMTHIARTRSRELFTLSVLAVALGVAVASTLVFGVSLALGAFLSGMIVGRSDHSSRAASDALPLRDAFAVLFFVSIGMLFDPGALLESPGLAAAALGIVMVARPLAGAAFTYALGYPSAITIPTALSRTQIGEFSFILAGAGAAQGVLPAEASDLIIAVALISIVLNPLLYRASPGIVHVLSHGRTRHGQAKPMADDAAAGLHRAIVVGYGPTGRMLARLLRENALTPTVIELSLENARQARADGFEAIYGDAANPQILEEAGARAARTIVLTSSAMDHAEDAIREAREFSPDIHVIARAAYARDVPPLRAAGAGAVFSGEAEVALAMTEAMMTRLGATAEQIDRERARVREEIKN